MYHEPCGWKRPLMFPDSILGLGYSPLPPLEPPRVSSSMPFNPAWILSSSVPLSICQLSLEGLQPLCLAGRTLASPMASSFSLGPPVLQQAGRTCTWHLRAQPSAKGMQDYCLPWMPCFKSVLFSLLLRVCLSLWLIGLVHRVHSSCVQWSCHIQQISFRCRHPLPPQPPQFLLFLPGLTSCPCPN